MEPTELGSQKDWFARTIGTIAVVATLASAYIHAWSVRGVGELASSTAERVAQLEENRALIQRADARWKLLWQERQAALDDLWQIGIFEEAYASDLHHRADYVATAIVPKLERSRSVFPDSTSSLIDDFLISFKNLDQSPDRYREARDELLRALRQATKLNEPKIDRSDSHQLISAPK